MDNKEKRKLLTKIFRSVFVLTAIIIASATYLVVDKIVKTTVNNLLWLDITMLSVLFLITMILFANSSKTRKIKSKYRLAKFLHFISVLAVLGAITLCVMVYIEGIDIFNMLHHVLCISLVLLSLMLLISHFLIGMSLNRFTKTNSIQVDSVSEVPTFDDEIVLKKKLNELQRKLEIKKVQEKIDSVEKELDTK